MSFRGAKVNWNIPLMDNRLYKLQANCSWRAPKKGAGILDGLRINFNVRNKQALFGGDKGPDKADKADKA